MSGGVISPPPHPCGRLKESSDEESLQVHPIPTHIEIKKNNEREKEEKEYQGVYIKK
jgi:hypothetical protein